MPLCPYCHTVVSEDNQFCPGCGRSLAVREAAKGKRNKKLAGIIVACTIAIIAAIVLISVKPWERTYTLSVSINPPQSGSVSSSGGEYESGVQVALTASPASDYTFDHWSGSASGTVPTITITMDSDKSLTAHFDTTPTVPEVLFSDDFSDESSGWLTYDEYDGRVAYLNGCFHVKDYTVPDWSIYGESQHYFTDFILEVETWLVDGTDDNYHVVFCRWKDEDNCYGFGISADGYYVVNKFVDGETTTFVGPTYSSYIQQGQGVTNSVWIECIGSDLSLSVNGHLLWEGTDATFGGGDIALAADAIAGTFTEVAFDNIIVTKPPETIPTVPALLFSDDFSEEAGVWDTYSDENGSVFYENGWLHLVNYTSATFAIATYAYQHLTDFVLEVETKLVGGTDNNWHQVACRYQDDYDYYEFSISADGYYYISRYIGGEAVRLTGSTPVHSSYINQGVGAVNLIRIECIGSSLSLSINGHVLATVTDTTFSGGDIGLAATSLEASLTEIAFDNIVVTKP